MNIELGGGLRPRKGFVNADLIEGADHRIDLDRDRLPFPDDSVDEVYSSHCFEHLKNHHHVLHEIVRVCHVGARVELRVPHWQSQMAMCAGHYCTVTPDQVRHWTKDFIKDWFGGCEKRLKLIQTELIPGLYYARAKELYPDYSDEDLSHFVPCSFHEIRFRFEAVEYGIST